MSFFQKCRDGLKSLFFRKAEKDEGTIALNGADLDRFFENGLVVEALLPKGPIKEEVSLSLNYASMVYAPIHPVARYRAAFVSLTSIRESGLPPPPGALEFLQTEVDSPPLACFAAVEAVNQVVRHGPEACRKVAQSLLRDMRDSPVLMGALGAKTPSDLIAARDAVTKSLDLLWSEAEAARKAAPAPTFN